MGHMSKQRRQTRRLLGLAEMGDYRHVQPGVQRATPRPFQPWRGPRDALTGAPVDPTHALVVHITSEDRVDNRPRRADHRAGMRVGPEDVTARPLRLHTAQVESAPDAGDLERGALGGHVYSGEMSHYLQSGLDRDRATARADDLLWWRSAYGRGRARAALIARYGAHTGHAAYLAAYSYASGEYDAEEIARASGHSVGWIARMIVLAECAARAVPSVVVASTSGARTPTTSLTID